LVGTSDYAANPAGFALHGAIHSHRHDVNCVAHTHSIAVSAVAMKEGGFDHNNFYGAQLIGRVGYHDFEGITLFADERPRMVASLGQKHVLVLRNHGIAVCERDIPPLSFCSGSPSAPPRCNARLVRFRVLTARSARRSPRAARLLPKA
jgi:ribulose-5-phosphate 4-epimerase/fuculose-1-phosphate aldolase